LSIQLGHLAQGIREPQRRLTPEGKGKEALAIKHLESGVIWGVVLLVAGVLLVLDAAGVQIVSDAFWGIGPTPPSM
jgi:hypothetical protein